MEKQNRLFGDDDIEYEDIDDVGEAIKPKNYKTKPDPARQAKTELQRMALSTVRMTQFSSRDQHKAFKQMEDMAIGADDQSYLMDKWIRFCIAEWVKANTPRPIRSLDNLIKYIGNETKRQDWTLKNRQRILINRKEEGRAMLEKALSKPYSKQILEDKDDIRL